MTDLLTVTIKSAGGYEAPWSVFKGSVQEVRDSIEEFYGIEHDDSLTLSEVVLNANVLAQGAYAVSSGLKAKATAAKREPKPKPELAPKSEPKPEPEAPAEDDGEARAASLALAMAEAATVDDLRTLWVDNKELFNEYDVVKKAYSARGKELTS